MSQSSANRPRLNTLPTGAGIYRENRVSENLKERRSPSVVAVRVRGDGAIGIERSRADLEEGGTEGKGAARVVERVARDRGLHRSDSDKESCLCIETTPKTSWRQTPAGTARARRTVRAAS